MRFEPLEALADLEPGRDARAGHLWDEPAPGRVPIYGIGSIRGWTDEPNVLSPCIAIGRTGTVGAPRIVRDGRVGETMMMIKPHDPGMLSFLFYFLRGLDWEPYTDVCTRILLSPYFWRVPVPLPERGRLDALCTAMEQCERVRRAAAALSAQADVLDRVIYARMFAEIDGDGKTGEGSPGGTGGD